MSKPFKVLQIGLGAIGQPIAFEMLARDNLKLVGVVDINPEYRGKTVADVLSNDVGKRVPIFSNLRESLERTSAHPADIAVIATSSHLEQVMKSILTCLDVGLHVVSICEELSFPYRRYPKLAKKIDAEADEVGRSVLGTGINPGFLMDLLPLMLTGPCIRFNTMRITRVIDSSTRRTSFQEKVGTGMKTDEFEKAIEEGEITGHVGLLESIYMIDDILKLSLDEIKERPPEAVIAEGVVETPIGSVEKGDVVGLRSVGVGLRKDQEIVKLEFVAHAGASPEYDEILIDGHPEITQRIEGGVMGDHGTVGMVLNAIPLVIRAAPGLVRMADLGIPRNTQQYYKET
ncbi:MAG: dihydrodipicolinate reductase [Candidatus Thorarchaeota archaeon]|nr:dihydrodipicolinate reductase [Candidatus Thorarchaeota archaeon]